MKLLTDHEEYLVYAKIAGSLSKEEEAACEALLESNAAARDSYQQLLQKLPQEDVANSFSRFRNPDRWPDSPSLIGATPEVKSASVFRRLVIAAAAAILLGVAGTLWLQTRQTVPKNPLSPTTQSILLTLPDGQQIDLSREKGVINNGTTQLTNSGSSLKYQEPTQLASVMNTLLVPNGKNYEITLSDNTKIWLNADTRLEFPFSFTGNSREIKLEGEAYLEVSAIPDKPFIVHLPHSTIQVLGTSFNVNSYEEGVDQVALVEGAVRMKAGEQALMLKPGKTGIFVAGQGLHDSPFDAQKVLAWRDGLYYFKNAPINEISRVLNRWYNMDTRVDNITLQQRKFTGVVDKNQPVDIFLNNLKAISGIDCYVDKDGVLHFK